MDGISLTIALACASCRSKRLTPMADPEGHPEPAYRREGIYTGAIRYSCDDCQCITSLCPCPWCFTPKGER